MKKLMIITTLLLLLQSCKEYVKYPIYTLKTIDVIPDSLKTKHRDWVKETIRAASQNMTGGDYEDVDVTIMQAKRTADELFSVQVLGLNKSVDENYYNDLQLTKEEFTKQEENIFQQLKNNK